MLRDNLVGLIEPMLSGAGAYPLALRTNRKQSSDDRPACLENPRPAGAESTLTENVASPFHAEPGQAWDLMRSVIVLLMFCSLLERGCSDAARSFFTRCHPREGPS